MTALAHVESDRADAPRPAVDVPLVLALDGGLLRTRLASELAVAFVRQRPWRLLLLLGWLLRGRGTLRRELAARAVLAVELLPIDEALAARARAAAAAGHDVAIAIDGDQPAAALVAARFGLAVRIIERDAAATAPTPRPASAAAWARAMRLHQWVKNGLVFLPLLLAGHALDADGWAACGIVFAALGLIASGTYLINDLVDLDHDRQHWSKRARPLASGQLGLGRAALTAALLIAAGFALAATAGGMILVFLAAYCVASFAYSFWLKRVPLLDVMLLAGLYTARFALGAAAAEVALSNWLGTFSMFLFVSLALAKRAAELANSGMAEAPVNGRGYIPADAGLVHALGASSGVAAVVILVLYLVEEAFAGALYSSPRLLWTAPVLVGLWIGRIWLLSVRGRLNDDPVHFALRDRVSLWLGAGVLASFLGAAILP